MAQRKENFWSRYSKLCLKNKVYPSRSVLKDFKSTELSCPVEAIRSEHWKYILPALCNDNSLTKVHFASCVSPHEDEEEVKTRRNKRNKGFPTPYGRTEKNINTITLSLAGLLHSSQTLIILKLENLSLKNLDAEQLSLGLSKSCYLKFFSLAGCNFEEGAFSIICRGLNRSSVSWVDFSSCALNLSEIEALSNVIKVHGVRRCNQMFPNTLRYKIPHLQELPGLNRVSLNYNSLEDEALNLLIESMADDLWMKAVDLQNCDIDDEGAEALLNLAKSNASITLIDLRLNEIDEHLLKRLAEQLALNKVGKDIKYMELPLWKPSELVRKFNDIGKVKAVKKNSVHKFKLVKKIPKSYNYPVKSPPSVHNRNIFMKDVSVQTAKDKLKDSKDLPMTLSDFKKQLNHEMKLRRFLSARYNEIKNENEQLRELLKNQNDDIYIDQETYFDIKHTFEKLKIFFDVMKKYGLWEYISMLGFDESTDVIIEENDTLKCLKVTRKENYFDQENTTEPDREPERVCCNCRKMDSSHKITDLSDDSPEGIPNSIAVSNAKSPHNKSKVAIKEDPMNERVAYRLLQEVMNDYNTSPHQVLNAKPAPGKMPEPIILPQENTKPCSSKQSGTTSPKMASGAHMLIKKFSYSNMPKQLKELVSPTDFYNIVKKELERCESEARKPTSSAQVENSTSANTNSTNAKQSVHKKVYRSEVNAVSTLELKDTSTRLPSRMANDDDDDDHENISISELIAREKASKMGLCKKEYAKSISLSSSKIHKNTNHAKIKETKSLMKSEQMLPKLKLKLSGSYQTNSQSSSKKVQSKSKVSVDEINSSDSIVSASDKLSRSSVSSSSSNKSQGKSSSDHTDSEPQKSYIESLSDASTFKDVESISDIEIASQVFSPSVSEKAEHVSDNKNISSAKVTKDGSTSSQSSTLKGVSESKNSKPLHESTVSGSSSIKDESKKSDKSTKTNTPQQGKTKNANKHNNKNRPKSNSSKSSSVPSLSDITTVSSQSLNTDSVMKQLSGSEDKSKGEK